MLTFEVSVFVDAFNMRPSPEPRRLRFRPPSGTLPRMNLSPAALAFAGLSLGCGSAVVVETGGGTGDCELGTLDCGCRSGSRCDANLACIEGSCVSPGTADGMPTTDGEPQVVCCHDEAYVDAPSPYGHLYCEIEGLELGEACVCRGDNAMAGIGCMYGGEPRVPFCCYGDIAECCPVGPAPAPGARQNPWTIECARCACGTPETAGVGSPTLDPADADCD